MQQTCQQNRPFNRSPTLYIEYNKYSTSTVYIEDHLRVGKSTHLLKTALVEFPKVTVFFFHALSITSQKILENSKVISKARIYK